MLLRKSRKHLQGASNRAATDGTFYNTFYKPYSAPKKEILKRHNLTCSTSHLKTRKHQLRNSHEISDGEFERTTCENKLEGQLRKIYQGRRNIVKAVDGWGFDARGFITRDAFNEKVKEKLGMEPDEEEVKQVLQKYCRSSEKIDAKELISLIHGKTEGSLFNETLFSTDQVSKQRQLKIENLKEDVKTYQKGTKSEIDYGTINKFLFKVNSAISKLKDMTDGKLTQNKQKFFSQLTSLADYGDYEKEVLKKIQNIVDYEDIRYNIQSHNSVDHLFLDPILRKTHISAKKLEKYQTDEGETFANKMLKSSTSTFQLLRNSQKRQDFDPKTMLNTNQQKTRFGLSKFTQESTYNEKPFLKQNVSPNQKDLILQSIKSQADIHKQRYENKLQKLRFFQQTQSDNIAKRQGEALERDRKRLDRIRHEQQAYNYVNFIKKKWQ